MIEVRNLVKRFGDKEAVRGISFTARPGEVTGYLGPNGAGKSTTVRMIVGALAPTSGEVEVCGIDVATSPVEAKRRIGYVPDSAALYNTLTPHEYLSLVAELHELPRQRAAERIGQLFEAFHVTDAADTQIAGLSKGTRQKVLLSSALLHDPDVLLFDEPLNGLDVNAALTFRQIIAGLVEQGRTVLFCSHLLDVVERLCTRVIVLDQGRIVACDSTAALLSGGQATLEAVFRKLTRREEVDETVGAFLDSLDANRQPSRR